MELHGGRLVITSELGVGTEVSCHFPARRMVMEGLPAVEQSQGVVDDDGAKTYAGP